MQLHAAQKYEAVLPIPDSPPVDQEKYQLGKKLYYSNFFSKNNDRSCASCHILQQGGADNLPRYKEINHKIGNIQTPTVLNASLNFRQFWNGRVKTLIGVVDDHLQDPTIFANDWPVVIDRFTQDEDFAAAFKKSYEQEPNQQNIKDALHVFLLTLLTPNSPFDRYLKGDNNAISAEAKKGFRLFKEYGCITCHEGPNFGGNLFQKMGIYQDYFATQSHLNEADLGRFSVTGKEEDKFVFKVPSLRNVALSAPYFHDGSAKTLQEAVALMGIYEVGQPIPDYEIKLLVTFLNTLTGNIPENVKEEKH